MVGAWRPASSLLHAASTGMTKAMDKAVLQIAHELRAEVLLGFRTQAPAGRPWKPLSPWTLAGRRAAGNRGTKARFATGTTVRNIVVRRTGGAVLVGIMRSARHKKGKSLTNIAIVQENGATIRVKVTPKMRRYIFWMMRKGGLGKSAGGGRARDKSSGRFIKQNGVQAKRQRGNRRGKYGLAKGTLLIRIPARPAFKPIWNSLRFGAARAYYQKEFERLVLKNLGSGFLG